jgi:hypothetical protein
MENLDLPGCTRIDRKFLMGLPDQNIDTNFFYIDHIIQKAKETNFAIIIAIDSSIACKTDIIHDLYVIRQMIAQDRPCEIILLDTRIGHVENMYKLKNKVKYCDTAIDWKYLQNFINICERSSPLPNDITLVTTSMSHMHLTLVEHEQKYSSYGGFSMTNTINDEAQLHILQDYTTELQKHIDTIIPVMYTNDVKMKVACLQTDIIPINLEMMS